METEPRTVGVRLPADLAGQLDREIKRLKGTHPGVGWSDAGVLRMALIRYFESQTATTADVA